MGQRTLVAVLTVIALIALVSGCAGPVTGPSTSGAVASAPMSKLSGTWYGTFGWVGASLYTDEGDCILRIKEDGMFTWTVTPSGAANNLAKVWTWSGTAVRSGTRVTFRTSQGPWVTLIRSGNTLYGVAKDPMVGATIMMKFEREGSRG